jgi:UDP-glucose 4-epimerase
MGPSQIRKEATEENGIEKALVTGANGFIGRQLCGNNHIGMIRDLPNIDGFIQGDLLDLDSLVSACKGIDVIYHCAGYAHAFTKSDPLMHWKINFEGTKNLLHAAVICGVKKFIFFSSVKTEEEVLTAYGESKLAAEGEVLKCGKEFNIHVVNLRLSMVYGFGSRGNLERIIRGVAQGWFPPIPNTNNKRCLIHIRDVISAAKLVARSPKASGNTYILTDGNYYSTHYLYQEIRKALGLPPASWFIPKSILKALAIFGDLVGALTKRVFPLNSETLKRLTESEVYTSEKIRQDLGWQSKVSLEAGLKDSIDAFEARKK